MNCQWRHSAARAWLAANRLGLASNCPGPSRPPHNVTMKYRKDWDRLFRPPRWPAVTGPPALGARSVCDGSGSAGCCDSNCQPESASHGESDTDSASVNWTWSDKHGSRLIASTPPLRLAGPILNGSGGTPAQAWHRRPGPSQVLCPANRDALVAYDCQW